MGIVDKIWVLILSTINVFRYLACLQLIVYLLYLDWEPMACSQQFEMGLKARTKPSLRTDFTTVAEE